MKKKQSRPLGKSAEAAVDRSDEESASGNRPDDRSPTANDPERRRNEGPGQFPQRFHEGGTSEDLLRGGFQRGDRGGFQASTDDVRYSRHPLERKPVPQPDPDAGTDERILQRVRQRLAESQLPQAMELTVTVQAGEVVLEGWVERAAQRDAIEAEAAQCGGVRRVENRISVRAP